MTKLLIALAIIVVGGGAFLYFQPAEAPVTTEGDAMGDTMLAGSDDAMKHDDSMVGGDAMMGDEGKMMEDGTMMEEATVTVDLTGKNFEFSKKEIRVKEGDVVKINFTSESGFHDWVVDEFNAKTAQVQGGNSSSVTFVADKKGTFEYYCSVGQHRANGMVGTLIVE